MKEAVLSGKSITKDFCENTVLYGIDIDIFAGDFGFVFQCTHLISNLTLSENIRMARLIGTLSDNETKTRADALIARMNLEGAKDRLPSQVSGGEAQRAAVARAVINKPSILFADAPTGTLNKANSEAVLNLLSSFNSDGQSVLLVAHDKEAALRGNRVLYLEDGAIIGELELPVYKRQATGRTAVNLAGRAWDDIATADYPAVVLHLRLGVLLKIKTGQHRDLDF